MKERAVSLLLEILMDKKERQAICNACEDFTKKDKNLKVITFIRKR